MAADDELDSLRGLRGRFLRWLFRESPGSGEVVVGKWETAELVPREVPDDLDLNDPDAVFDFLMEGVPWWQRLLFRRGLKRGWDAGQSDPPCAPY